MFHYVIAESEASDRCQTERRKTINGYRMLCICYEYACLGDDVVWAMSTLGFDEHVTPLKIYLTKYRQATKGEKAASMLKSHR